jgi:hypothetical protein
LSATVVTNLSPANVAAELHVNLLLREDTKLRLQVDRQQAIDAENDVPAQSALPAPERYVTHASCVLFIAIAMDAADCDDDLGNCARCQQRLFKRGALGRKPEHNAGIVHCRLCRNYWGLGCYKLHYPAHTIEDPIAEDARLAVRLVLTCNLCLYPALRS